MTLTTWEDALCRKIEPGVCATGERVQVLQVMKEAGIPTVVWLSPILPFINDTKKNITGIVRACADAGVYGILCFGMGLTLREGNREYFYQQLDRQFPGLKEQYIRRYGSRYEVSSPWQRELMQLFHQECSIYGIETRIDRLWEYLSLFEDKWQGRQLSLFE